LRLCAFARHIFFLSFVRYSFFIPPALFFLLCGEPVFGGGLLGRKIKLELFFFDIFYF
jgi:hypothetical protein